jgi:hypothetical protein
MPTSTEAAIDVSTVPTAKPAAPTDAPSISPVYAGNIMTKYQSI